MTANASARSYNAIIEKTLSKAIRLGLQSPKNRESGMCGIAGFCMLQGPTGGGKSSALFRHGKDDGLPPTLEQIKVKGHQAIFVTHRWNILHDVYSSIINSNDSSGKPLTASVIYAQDENIISALLQQPLPHEGNSQNFPDPFTALSDLDSKGLLSHEKFNFLILSKVCRGIINEVKYLEVINTQRTEKVLHYINLMKKEIKRRCSYLERLLLKNMKHLEKQFQQTKKKYGSDAKLTLIAKNKLHDYRSNEWIRRIFPGIAWKDDKQHLLIMTTQKLFSSFYDGSQQVRISSKALSGHVVFVDEFDYQSDILQQLLAQSQLVHEPPECLGQLLECGRRLLKRMQYVESGRVPEIKERLEGLLNNLQTELEENNIDLREDRALVIPVQDYKDGKKFKSQYLFRADHMVTSHRLSMKHAAHGFEIREISYSEKMMEDTIDIDKFLRLMEKYIRQFSLMLTDFSASESEERDVIKELSSLLFDSANDYRPSYYGSTLPSLSLFALPQAGLPELKELIKSNILPNTHANLLGLTNWQLRQNTYDNELDPTRIQIRRAFLPTTPEGLLVSLGSRNLVFGLSATSYIERALGHFDVRWINSALRYIAQARDKDVSESFLGTPFKERPKDWFKRPKPYTQSEVDQNDQNEMIAFLSNKKADLRKVELDVTISDFNEELSEQERIDIIAHLSPDFFQESEIETSIYTQGYRENILLQLINVIGLAAKKNVHQGQLAYVNSAKYFKKWLIEDEAKASRNSIQWFNRSKVLEKEVWNNKLLDSFKNEFIPVYVNDQAMVICLLNAECQKRIGFKEAYQAAFDTNYPVLIITQTASATNGINLDFKVSSTKSMDLTCLYLIEARHFYFSPYDKNNENLDEMAHAGSQMRNLDKLRRSGEISRKEHRQYISAVMDGTGRLVSQLNYKIYKNRADYIKNTAADLQQQAGRLERVWDFIGKVEICISNELAQVLIKFASLPAYTNHKQILSDLNQKLVDRLLIIDQEKSGDFLAIMFTPVQSGEQAVHIIDEVLIPAIRLTRKDATKVEDVSRLWEQLGRAVLQLDYVWNPDKIEYGIKIPLKDWACIEKPNHSGDFTNIWYNPKTWQFFDKPDTGLINYRPDRLYRYIQSHSAIIDWFNKKGFRTSMYPIASELEDTYVLHPLVTQRILQGRLGEEAIRALLHDQKITTHTLLNNPHVLELYDFTIANSDFRVDAKFWGSDSLDKADQDYQEWLIGGADPDKAPLGLITKLEGIRRAEGNQMKLAILNFVSAEQDAFLIGFSNKLLPVDFNKADIVVLNGCLCRDKMETVTTGFNQFASLVFKQLDKKED